MDDIVGLREGEREWEGVRERVGGGEEGGREGREETSALGHTVNNKLQCICS